MNNHHDTSQSIPTALCARVAPLLPALDEWRELSALSAPGEAPTSDELTLASAHLADCAYCQAQRAAYARLDTALHRAVGLRAIAPLRTEEIMSELLRSPAETQATAPTSAQAQADAMPVSAQEPFPQTSGALAGTAFTAANGEPSGVAAVSAGRRASSPPRRRAPNWLAAVAAALVIALLAAGIVRSFGWRTSGGPSVATGSPTTYTGGLFKVEGPALTNITMVSPTEGWAFGLSHPGQPALMYHYLHGAWSPFTLSASARTIAMSMPTAMSFDSPTDGWAFFGRGANALHFDGHSWNPVARGTFTADASECVVGDVQMLTPTIGWGVCAYPTPGNTRLLLHYGGHSWSTEPLPTGLNVGPNTDVWLSSLSMLSATVGWAVGYTTGAGADPNQRVVGFILEDVDGQWTLQSTHDDEELRSVSALPSGDVWAAGDQVKYHGGSGANRYAQTGSVPLVLRYQHGQWASVTVPATMPDPTNTNIGAFTQVIMRSPDDGWALGNAASRVQNMDASQRDVFSLVWLHYDGARWRQVAPPPLPAVKTFVIIRLGVAANGDCWAVGQTEHSQGGKATYSPLILRYHNGLWSVYLS